MTSWTGIQVGEWGDKGHRESTKDTKTLCSLNIEN